MGSYMTRIFNQGRESFILHGEEGEDLCPFPAPEFKSHHHAVKGERMDERIEWYMGFLIEERSGQRTGRNGTRCR